MRRHLCAPDERIEQSHWAAGFPTSSIQTNRREDPPCTRSVNHRKNAGNGKNRNNYYRRSLRVPINSKFRKNIVNAMRARFKKDCAAACCGKEERDCGRIVGIVGYHSAY